MVRCWVAAARPGDVPMARRMLRAVSEFAMWMYDTSGVVDVRLLLPGNVEFWCNQFNGHQSKTWRSNKRWLLRRVGRAAYPDGWPPVGELTRKHVPVPPVHIGRRDSVSDLGLPSRSGGACGPPLGGRSHSGSGPAESRDRSC